MKEISLAHGKGVALVDDADYPILSQYKWRLSAGYARAEINGMSVLMHRLVMGAKRGQEVDHRNGDKLDNRRSNLRFSTHSQNMANVGQRSDNTSGFKGVYWNRQTGKFRARIKPRGKHIYLGAFDDAQEAARVYDRAARKYFGSFARTNFPRAT
jgi:hypothetical protein